MTQSEVNKKCDEINAIDLYVNQHKTTNEIGQSIGISNHGQVLTYLKLKGVPRRRAKKRIELRERPPVGQSFGLWTVISDEVKVGTDRAIHWLCQCKCGNTAWKKPSILRKSLSTRCKRCGNKNYFTENGEINVQALIVSKFNQINQPREREILVIPTFLALSITFTIAPCSELSSAWIKSPSGYFFALSAKNFSKFVASIVCPSHIN